MSDNGRWIIRKFLIIIGLILLAITVIGGLCIIYFAFKFSAGNWLPWWQYMLAMLGYAIALAVVALIGIFIIYLAIDTNEVKQ